MSARKNRPDRLDAFGEKNDLEQVADEIFGASAAPELNTGRIVARPIPIDQIWADVRQPRRVIPASIRLVWNGSPGDVPRLIETWASIAANTVGRTIDLLKIIDGEGEGIDTDGTPAIYESFISLLRLAGSIQREGLINPISVIDGRDHYIIESGERRWLAYWLLKLFARDGARFARIPAVAVSGQDAIWRQASENTARRSLNAVGMARQLALLVMAARGLDQYQDYEQIVPPGGSDRRYYAQVADGNVHRIPKGAGERIEAAMGLTKEQLSRYRDILRLTDDDEINDILWLRGDIEDWPERAFREVCTLPLGNLRQIVSRSGWSLDDLRTAAAVVAAPAAPPPRPMGPPPSTPLSTQWGGAGGGVPTPPSPLQRDTVTRGHVGGVSETEADQMLEALRAAFDRAYALESDPRTLAKFAAKRATSLLNSAQTQYDAGRFAAARQSISNALEIMDEVTAPPTQSDPPRQPMSQHEMRQLLVWAWRWGKGHQSSGGWFTRQDCQAQPGDLGLLVLQNYLQQGTLNKNGRDIPRYRITAVGCRYLGAGFDLLNWDAPPPLHERSEMGSAGVGSPSDNPPSAGSHRFILNPGDSLHNILLTIRSLSSETHNTDAASAITALLEMTHESAQQLRDDGEIEEVFQIYYDSINSMLSSCSQIIGELFDNLLNSQ